MPIFVIVIAPQFITGFTRTQLEGLRPRFGGCQRGQSEMGF
jgi:hypothetical protein